MKTLHQFTVADDNKDTIIAHLRRHLPDSPSWTQVRKVLRSRRVFIGAVMCMDEARRLGRGEVVSVSEQPGPKPPSDEDVDVKYVDDDLVIVEKPPGMETLRRKSDLSWSWTRKNLQPTLDECVPRLIGEHSARKHKSERNTMRLPKLFPVHRIDRDSSGLLTFARNEEAQTRIIHQFAQHDAVRKYLALIPGSIKDQTVTSQFIRDRGDGLRGSTTDTSIGQSATTHFKTLRRIGGFSELECKLETGRTNQIRIHLAELGNPICGDIKYRGPFGKPPVRDRSGIFRMALHAAELRIQHPTSGVLLNFVTPWPDNMLRFLAKLEDAQLAKRKS
jgi:23S rRNA pseudouridine1911/1915/1917 synthase